MQEPDHATDVLIVGAGMAGLAAASELKKGGRRVLVVEARPCVGGRLASRRIAGATFDTGAQFITAREPRFAAAIDKWLKAGVVAEWYRSAAGHPGGSHPRWRGNPTMDAIAQCLARDVKVLLGAEVALLRRSPGGWEAILQKGEAILARAALLTPPAPQSLALLQAGGVELAPESRARLESVQYAPCLAVMAVLDGPTQIPHPGALAQPGGPIAWIADNQRKGISSAPAITLHATPTFSSENWDRDREESGRELLRAAASWLGSEVIAFQVRGWRYSKAIQTHAGACLTVRSSPPLLIAGDAFGGPRVEGAALSGWAAADALL